ncbi:Alpha/Beta hydrolase protein [Mrakia frigida]|uniref:Alpha/Beta hydrolase protein n=1 Tax=Mrakia frigida TaxID=29902 RepID=UPI003FCC0C9C
MLVGLRRYSAELFGKWKRKKSAVLGGLSRRHGSGTSASFPRSINMVVPIPPPLTFTYKTIDTSPEPVPLQLDVFLPPLPSSTTSYSPSSPLRVIVALHMGGFVAYDRTSISPWTLDIAREQGYVLIAPDYRLLVGGGRTGKAGGGADIADSLRDIVSAYEWSFGGELEKALEGAGVKGVKLDSSRVSLVGFSAGSWLSLVLPFNIPKHLPAPVALVLFYPATRPFSNPWYSTARQPASAISSSSISSIGPTLNPFTLLSSLFPYVRRFLLSLVRQPIQLPLLPTSDLKHPSRTASLPSFGLTPTYMKTAHRLFLSSWHGPILSGTPFIAPSVKRELEKEGAAGYRGMLCDWTLERGTAADLFIGKGIEEFVGLGKNDPADAEDADQVLKAVGKQEEVKELMTPFIGRNTPIGGIYPPSYFVHGASDTLVQVEESEWAQERLGEVEGVETTLVKVEGVDHGFDGTARLEVGGKWEDVFRGVERFLVEKMA